MLVGQFGSIHWRKTRQAAGYTMCIWHPLWMYDAGSTRQPLYTSTPRGLPWLGLRSDSRAIGREAARKLQGHLTGAACASIEQPAPAWTPSRTAQDARGGMYCTELLCALYSVPKSACRGPPVCPVPNSWPGWIVPSPPRSRRRANKGCRLAGAAEERNKDNIGHAATLHRASRE